MFLMIDNYDSFVYNLVRYFEELGEDIKVYRNDKITIEDIKKMDLEGIIISPGPKDPKDAGNSIEIIKNFRGEIPILGICLGHQAIGYVFGGKIVKGERPMHGKISNVYHNNKGIFKGIKNPLKVTRYHSLVVDKESLPSCFSITCETEDGVIMGLKHKEYDIEGVQFHPEAELTECGHEILENFIKRCKI
ncbi:aminodeoxychorismate/anthranilate synthase component II [Clostridium aestuarii]|uniref:Aminodeoxychorismate/anthranilate synthase component II n=1 Tax=Clostridium aestuarii TaxID=338193 RepID=A0ABT4D3B6_9CLOT|nr:aminodeoxychorismate/anthranilate synthase component II [Clostridium aestuarii]MCY6484690.1 aminodeoxychorismate/anthranilate synthase component II [Clostridium aestuarii]